MAKKRRAVAEINVVPYIDVMLVLLIIFMITAPIVQQGVEIELPQVAANSLPPEQLEPVILYVSKTGEYYLNIDDDLKRPIGDDLKRPIGNDVVAQRVALVLKQKPKTPILVSGDRKVDYDSVITAMALLQSAGVEKVGLMTDQPEL